MLSCRRLSKSAIQNTSALTFISKIESKLDGLKVFFIHNLLPSFECPACYCSVQTAIAINHARSYGGTGHAVVVEGYFQASRKSDGQSLSVIQVADGWYSGVRYLNFYHSGLTNRTATLLY